MSEEKRIQEIRERVEKATQGEWFFEDHEHSWNLYGWFECDPEHKLHPQKIIKAPKGIGDYWPDKEDAEFIAHSREDIPWLLTQLAALRAELEAKENSLCPDCHGAVIKTLNFPDSQEYYCPLCGWATNPSETGENLADCKAKNAELGTRVKALEDEIRQNASV